MDNIVFVCVCVCVCGLHFWQFKLLVFGVSSGLERGHLLLLPDFFALSLLFLPRRIFSRSFVGGGGGRSCLLSLPPSLVLPATPKGHIDHSQVCLPIPLLPSIPSPPSASTVVQNA